MHDKELSDSIFVFIVGGNSMKTWTSQKSLSTIATLAILGTIAMGYQNCARAKFSIDPGAKAEALGKDALNREQGDDGSANPNGPGDDANNPRGNVPGDDAPVPSYPTNPNPIPGNDPSVPGTPPQGNDPTTTGLDVLFRFVCSNAQSNSAGSNLLSATALKLVIVSGGQSKCELTGDFKNAILNNKKISFKPCPNLAVGSYSAFLVDTKISSSDEMALQSKNLGDFRFKVNKDGSYQRIGSTSATDILYDINKDNSMYASLIGKFGSSTDATQAKCDSRVSPLIISMNSSDRGIKLTSPLDGIQFDILGERSFPLAHSKKQISWLSPESQDYFFITLPSKSGQVDGINEMFGDNTRGPDGQFAANGYAALAKYDDDKDKLITSDDEIFEKLRLWGDSNRDGIAQPEELLSLKDKGITVIDLSYESRYKETDQYGNQTLMKSVVKTEDGKLHLVFDLWFRYLNITK
jgi:hypothetical protein